LRHGAILTVDHKYAAYLSGTWVGLPARGASIWLGDGAEDWPVMTTRPVERSGDENKET